MNYKSLNKNEAIEVINLASERIKEIDFQTVKGILGRIEVEYPTNQAGGTGNFDATPNYKTQVVEIETRTYGCDYNNPYILNESEIKTALAKIGWRIEDLD